MSAALPLLLFCTFAEQKLIPRIVHQTWHEKLDPDKYPNMSRLVQSFRFSGWEHRFYRDDQSASFLSTHFPPEVREAYDTLLPGAFKADLFRYCVLLIHGGLYADIDVLLESFLDVSVGPDVGFMAAVDEVSLLCLFRYECYAFFAPDSCSHNFVVLHRRT
jgi:mannosyltransferase OCH1-like enzyme